jgi:hypothetical protein
VKLVEIEFLDSQDVGGGGWVTKREVAEGAATVLKFCGFIISEDDLAYTVCQGYPSDYESRRQEDFAYLNVSRIPKGAVIKVTELVGIGMSGSSHNLTERKEK